LENEEWTSYMTLRLEFEVNVKWVCINDAKTSLFDVVCVPCVLFSLVAGSALELHYFA